ncbi:MAG: membrane protein insertion efficiency factor YidD [Acidobacteriota bacterium]
MLTLPRRLAVAVLSAYKMLISPWLPPACRFMPSCSVYAAQAIQRDGLMRGGWLGLRRLLRCHPFSSGGLDPLN